MSLETNLHYWNSTSVDHLASFLQSYNIDTSQYGTGDARGLDILLHQLQTGECKLITKNGQLMRVVNGVGIQVYYQDKGVNLYLKETVQIFADGRVKKIDKPFSVSEKMFPDEDVIIAAKRGLLEEIGVMSELDLKNLGSASFDPLPSKSFPGLVSQHHFHAFSAYLPEKEFVRAGYVEHQEEKENYFEWVESNMLQ